jgi:phosphatidylserine/phosphatidylglycerophosphate/cardiolipin synthase-like enzyme
MNSKTWTGLARQVVLPLTALLSVLLTMVGCQRTSLTDSGSVKLTRLPTLPQDQLIQAYFNHSEAAEYLESDRQSKGQPMHRAGDNLEQVMIDAMTQAKTEIKIAVQEFRLPRMAQALAISAKNGIKIEIILENKYSMPYSAIASSQASTLNDRDRQRYDENRAFIDINHDGVLSAEEIQTRDALVILDNAKISRRDDTSDGSKGSGLMHHKFMVIDGKTTIVTSANWTTSDIHGDITNPSSLGNANSLVKIESRDVANAFVQEFDLMYQTHKFKTHKPDRPVQTFMVGDSKLKLHFSPIATKKPWTDSSNSLIADTADQAKSSLDLALFVFSDRQLSDRLSALPTKNVAVRGLFDPGFFRRPYSNSLDMLGIPIDSPCRQSTRQDSSQSSRQPDDLSDSKSSRKLSRQNSRKSSRKPKLTSPKPWPTIAASVGVPKLKPGDLLHHKFAIIDRSTVILGSHNWTTAGNTKNDETLMVIENKTIAAHYQREFDRLSKDAVLGLPNNACGVKQAMPTDSEDS